MKLRPTLAAALLFLGSLAAAETKPLHVAMIFDDGPDANQTPKLLAILAEEKVHVTFGTVARNAEANPALLQSVVAAGHELANHSYTHQQPKTLSDDALKHEMVDASRTIEKASGFTPKWYWPPFVAYDDRQPALAAEAGMQVTHPTKVVVSGDYMQQVSAEEILKRATTGVEDGCVILFHEWRPETAAQLNAIITELKRQGCVFLTFSEMGAYQKR